MKVVICSAPADLLEERRRTGADRWDEMWDGVLHMPPMPNADLQELEWALETWLRTYWAPPRKARVFHNVNLASPGGWPEKDYRIPDLLLLAPERFGINKNEYFEGAPNVVVEIRSPGDEAYDKLRFYAKLAVPEVWIVDRDTKRPEIHILQGDEYREKPPGAEGWIPSDETGVELKEGPSQKLAIRLAGDDATRAELPEH